MAEKNGEKQKKQKFTGLAASLSQLSPDKRRAALEMSAALAGVSLRVSREFVEAVPEAAKILSADDLRNWAEMGRRLAMGNAETGAQFFSNGVEGLAKVPKNARASVFQISTRQLVLSSSIALETFNFIPELEHQVDDDELLSEILKLCVQIANRSAKHSSEFLRNTPPVAEALNLFGARKAEVAGSVIELGTTFANRTGGMTADLCANLPKALTGLSADNAVLVMSRAATFLEFGGSVTLHFVTAASEVLRTVDAAFDDWCRVLTKIGSQGNAVLIAFLRASPKFFRQIAAVSPKRRKSAGQMDAETVAVIKRVLQLTGEISETDAESALAAFRSSTAALKSVSLEQF
ncbi:MAG: hypothetical protein H7070_15640, partial [Saprospiraceae bacterium]|nr:hypothetical protein [Pyrinomonadaceae bacterium]